MRSSICFLGPSEAAGRLGVSVKTLRVYEDRGLVRPTRTAAGWRTYGPEELALAAEIVSLRSLGFSLAQVEDVLRGVVDGLEVALAAHQVKVEGDLAETNVRLNRIRALRRSLVSGATPAVKDLADLASNPYRCVASFDLPWPWGGERFELCDVRLINYIVGPLGSGKTRLAMMIAQQLPDTRYLGLDRLERVEETRQENADARSEIEAALAWLREDGAFESKALFALIGAIYLDRSKALVIDLIEQGLDETTQYALMAHLRGRPQNGRPLFIMTRSSAILDLPALGPHETITFCPANHSSPFRVGHSPAARGYDVVETCLGVFGSPGQNRRHDRLYALDNGVRRAPVRLRQITPT